MKTCTACGVQYADTESFCPRDGSILRRTGGDAQDLIGEMVSDRYRVIRKLGEGGMGTVFLAEQVKMSRKVALKVLKAAMVADPDAVSRFNREAANASRITHANVAAVYDFGETADGLTFLAMEFVDGHPLTTHLDESGRIHPKRAAHIIERIADGLTAAHDLGIVHRDLKPDNIMIATARNGSDIVKVVDFGIAKAAGYEGQDVTRSGQAVGTPEYMSPEQLVADQIDSRSDVYALGLVAFRILTGVLPFRGDTPQASVMMRLGTKPATLASTYPGVHWPEDVQCVLDHALDVNAQDRYQHAAEFAHDLRIAIDRMLTALGADATIAFPHPPPTTNRRRVVVVGLAAASVVLGAAIGMIAARTNGTRPAAASHDAPVTNAPASATQAGTTRELSIAKTIVPRSAPRVSAPPKSRVVMSTTPGTVRLVVSTGSLAPELREKVRSIASRVRGVALTDTVAAGDLTLRSTPTGFSVIGRAGDLIAGFTDSSSTPRLFLELLRYEMSLAVLRTLDPGSTSPAVGLDLDLGGGRTSFTLGQPIPVHIRASDAGYLTLIDVDASGTITVLHPSDDIDIGPVAAHQDIRFDQFRAGKPVGVATIRAIVTTKPLALQRNGTVIVSPDGPALADDIRRAVLKASGPKGEGWATRSLAYVIR